MKKKAPAKRTKKNADPKATAALVAGAADDKKALDIKIVDLKKRSSLADFVVICTAEAGPHINAICMHIDEKLKTSGKKHLHWDGKHGSNWKVLDLGSVIVHVMGEEERRRYNLDELFEKGAIIYHL